MRITELPLPAYNVLYLTSLTPGTAQNVSPNYEYVPYSGWGNRGGMFGGAPQATNEFTIDGAPNNLGGDTPAINPPPEMVQEFRVDTAPFDASVGNFAGGLINMVMKSGTNKFHGSLAFSHQSRPLNTHHLYTNMYIWDPSSGPATKEKEKFAFPFARMNRYRAVLDGPIYIPRLYDGRNKTFWTFGWDRLDRLRAEQSFFTIPTLKQRNGDFSELLALGSQYQIYDPATIAPAPGGLFSRKKLEGNIIPKTRFDPVAAKLLSFYPAPNVGGKADGQQNYFDPKPRTVAYRAEYLRVDHNFTPKHRIYGSYSHVDSVEKWNDFFHNETTGQLTDDKRHTLTLDDVYTFRSDLILNIRYNVNRRIRIASPLDIPVDLGGLGWPSSLINRLQPAELRVFPSISIDGYQGLGGAGYSVTANTQHFMSGSAAHMRGNHALKFGGEFRATLNNSRSPSVTPSVSFSTTWTRGPYNTSSASPLGQGLASFLLGYPTGGSKSINDSSAYINRYVAFFIHDDWRVTPRLTINIGLRWELELPLTERFNRMDRGFDLTVTNPISAAALAAYTKSPILEVPVSQFKTLGGVLYANASGVPRGLWNADKNNFLPRFGIAYKLNPKTVVRSGFGIYFLQRADSASGSQKGYSRSTSLNPTEDNGLTWKDTLSNPFRDPFLEPVGNTLGLLTNLGQSISFVDPDVRAGYMQRWTLNIQRELPYRILLDVGYLGNRAVGLSLSDDYAYIPRKYLSTSPERDQATINYLSAAVTNPFYGMPEFAGTSRGTSRTVSRSTLLADYPHFTGVSTSRTGGFSWYHAMLTSIERRFSSGYTFQFSYTWSKLMHASSRLNTTDPFLQHVIGSDDRPHRVVTSGILQFPFGKGRRWINTAPALLDHILGGWSLQMMYQYQTGEPIGWGNILFQGNIKDIPLPRSERTIDRYFNIDAGFERSSAKQLSQNIRTFPSRLNGVRGRGFNNTDLSLSKDFRLREGLKLNLKAEAQNLCNRAELGSLTTGPTSTLFGSYYQDPSNVGLTEQRRVTIVLRLAW